MQPHVEFAVLCDDFRLEVGKKVSLIGLYGKHLLLSSNALPTAIWKICFFQRWVGVEQRQNLQIELQGPSGRIHQPPLETSITPQSIPGEVTQLAIGIEPMPILEFGEFHLKTYLLPERQLVHDFTFIVTPNPELESTQLPLELNK